MSAAREIERAALAIHGRGANVIPLRTVDKTPATSFKRWMMRPQSLDDVARLFHRHEGNVGALGGVHSAAMDMGHIAFIDCDTARAFDMIGALIRSQYGRTLTAKSVRGGHYWLMTDEPVRTCKFDGGELRGRGAYVAAPPSLHPSGVAYHWIDVDAPILRINELPGVTLEAIPRERLPRLAARILAGDANVIGRYPSRSEVDAALMLSLVNAGYTFERIAPLFQSSRHESHLDATRRDYLKRLEAEYLRARDLPNTAAFTAAREFAGRVRTWALNAHTITGNVHTRETDRRVLLAHVEIVHRTGRMEWHMSRRDIEQAAQVGTHTAIKATHRLQAACIVMRSQPHRASYATKWTFGAGMSEVHHSHTLPKPVCVSGAPLSHPAFEASGLGRHTARTFAAIVDAPLTEPKIAEATGYSPRTVDRHLSRLVHHGLVASRPGERWQALPANLDDVAYALGTTDIAAKRRKRIERERARHAKQLRRLKT
jgi:DNA-binding transcriptional ArsR family regulator